MKDFENQLDGLSLSELRLARKILNAELRRETDPAKMDVLKKGLEEISEAIHRWNNNNPSDPDKETSNHPS